ncbi:hypothetical protein KI387_016018, partial [Taxus chinensis]
MALTNTERESSGNRQRMSGNSEVDQPGDIYADTQMGAGSGEDKQTSKKHTRYTPIQVEEMEEMFKVYPHPDEKARQSLSLRLGLTTLQVKFWFQNRRTQIKVQQERTENINLRTENERLRRDNTVLMETINSVMCSTCGGPSLMGNITLENQRLEMENSLLRDEIRKLSAIAANHIGRPIRSLEASPEQSLFISSQPNSDQSLLIPSQANSDKSLLIPSHIANPELSPVISSLNHGLGGFGKKPRLSSFDMPGSSSSISSGVVLNLDKSSGLEVAMNAMEELIRLTHIGEPLWLKKTFPSGDIEVLNVDEYCRSFPRGMHTNYLHTKMKREGTRHSAIVSMNGASLVDSFMDVNKWMRLFPSIVTKAVTLQDLNPAILGSRNGSLQLMFAEFQVLSHMVSTRQTYFFRYSQRHINGMWVVVDISTESLNGNASASVGHYHKHPSGCTIQEMPNGYSKAYSYGLYTIQVIWVEHAEATDKIVHNMYAQYMNSGMAFCAQRWLVNLQRQCEWFKTKWNLNRGVSTAMHRNMVKLSKIMTNRFYTNVRELSAVSQTNNEYFKITVKEASEMGHSIGVVICAGISIKLPVSPQQLFDFFRDEQTRARCGVLSSGKWEKSTSIALESDLANCISLSNVTSN